jgi:hypothetical protein
MRSKTASVAEEFPRFKKYLVFRRFLKYVTIGSADDCWIWKGKTKPSNGYGHFWWPEKHISSAHVAAYELFVGKRNGLCVCHSCDVVTCVNPRHLWLGTNKQNTQDMIRKGRKAELKPEDVHTAKLNWEIVREIRRLYATGIGQQVLAQKFRVATSNVSYIVNNKTWVEGEAAN